MSKLPLFPSLVLALLVVPPASLLAQTPERFTVGGDRIAVYDLAGEISVVPGTGPDVVVEVTRAGADAGQLKVEVSPIRNVSTLRIMFPQDRIIYPQRNWSGQSDFRVRDDGTFGGSDGDRDSRRIQVRSSGSGLEAHANLRVLVPAGKRVSVNIGVGTLDAANVNGDISLEAASANISADHVRGSLSIDTGSGDVTVTAVDGDLSVDTGSGNVKISGANGSEITIDTGSGDVIGSDIKSAHVNVDTGSGNINLAGISTASLSLDTGSGDVEVGLTSDTDELSVETGSGNVTIAIPASFGSTIDLDTSSGEVDSEVSIQVTRRGRQHLSGKIGDGQGRMDIETGSGDVTLRAVR
ncbi:MAG: DUF4097 family beta strand repeat-containing protein [Gemmatimonadota bacterium]